MPPKALNNGFKKSGLKCKTSPNPNVLLELGLASKVVGWDNIISVFNLAYGKHENIPFDIKFRKPLDYFLNEKLLNKKSKRKKED